ncbi:hypothetical protein BJ912DRAFT_855172 [Pholiota molesta]|nr:hypothetical protein BJ912DRAFT_855172 [Pholiota molesta]
MAKQKALTPQEIYKQRRQREENEKTAYLPPGLINHGNTCFMNSVLQGLIATRLLSDLVHFNPIPPEIQMTATTQIVSRRSPQLTNGHNLAGKYEQPWVNSMPIGDMFLTVMYKAWDSQAARRRDILSPKPILSALGQKYDQYLDFAQQDAHEFLRILLDAMRMEEQDIIKKRQPPPHPKKRRRTTLTPDTLETPTTDPTADPDAEPPLHSFVDMIFGGELTSILVCQKCKHVSQTYEDFNDISLSIKAEDYLPHNRKRDRFKKIVGRLTQFPGTAKPSPPPIDSAHAVEMLRASSVPPSPRTERDAAQLLAEHPRAESPRRRSLDVSVGGLVSESEVPAPEPTPSTSRNDALESDSPNPIVQVTEPEERHIEFAEPADKKAGPEGTSLPAAADKEMEKEKAQMQRNDDTSWAKIGRRISLSVGLGRSKSAEKEKDRKERDRKSRSMDRHSLGVPGAIQEDVSADLGIQKSQSAIHATSSTNTRSPSPRPSSSQPLSNLLNFNASSTFSPASIFPTVQRSKSPKPPKSSPAEVEYLRKILADVSTAPTSSNPFAMFKPPLLHGHSGHHSSRSVSGGILSTAGPGEKEKEKSTGAAWLGMGRNLTGIEECMRLFTAVEVLDGDNMVGCRRCWKIQNGMLHTSKGKDSDHDDEDEEPQEPSQHTVSSKPPIPPTEEKLNVNGVANLKEPPGKNRPSLKVQPPTPTTHIPTSLSTPTVSSYASVDDRSDTRSVSSLPTEATSVSLDESTQSSDDSPLSLSIISDSSDQSRSAGPGGMPIPKISTTAPPDTPTESTISISSRTSSLATKHPKDSSKPQLPRAVYGSNTNSVSKDSLAIPTSRSRKGGSVCSDTTTTDNESSEDESDTSSVSAESSSKLPNGVNGGREASTKGTTTTSTQPSTAQQQPLNTAPTSQKKPSKPKPVIMRPAYKRYLIATPPPVLVIHLKRFQQTSKTPFMSFSHGFKKLDDYISFPEYLDLLPFLAPRKEDYGLGKKGKEKERKSKKEDRCMYRLYAVVVHIGNMLGGHYVAYTALPSEPPLSLASTADGPLESATSSNPLSNASAASKASELVQSAKSAERQWAHISDTTVRLTTLEEVLRAKAYICMYERC